jgi:hypothetical protein
MGKLFELLAVEGDLEGTSKRIVDETERTFANKHGLFQGQHRHLEMFDPEETNQGVPDDHQELTETVLGKLDYMAAHVARYWDAMLQKESSNQEATSDLILEGQIIGKGLPATFLLGLENRLKGLRKVYDNIPTLAPGIKWVPDKTRGEGIWVQDNPEIRYKTAKTFHHKVLYEATAQHPAQIEKWEENVNVGIYHQEVWSGMLSSADKSRLLGRLNNLIMAVKKARMRANSIEIKEKTIGKAIFEWLHADV